MAKVTYEYLDFKKTPSIENYITSAISKLNQKLKGGWKRSSIKFKALVSARAPEGQAKEFLAELFIIRPRMAPVVIKKRHPDLRVAVHDAVNAAGRAME